jgi:DNA-binding IclR family transcriptional regulator
VRNWSFLTNHGGVLLAIAHDPGIRLRDIASTLDITERRVYGIVKDLVDSGYVVKEREGRRSRYEIQEHLPLHGTLASERTIGDVLRLLVDAGRVVVGGDGSSERLYDVRKLMDEG